MKTTQSWNKLRYHLPLMVCVLLIALLLMLPTGYEGAVQYQQAERCVGTYARR